jgi:hypothetical protein
MRSARGGSVLESPAHYFTIWELQPPKATSERNPGFPSTSGEKEHLLNDHSMMLLGFVTILELLSAPAKCSRRPVRASTGRSAALT